jgi:hypothetical protein
MNTTYQKIQLVHKEPGQECIEILKCAIVEDKVLKKYEIDKNTLINTLPEKIINSFLDFLGKFELSQREIILELIKKGEITLICDEEPENF